MLDPCIEIEFVHLEDISDGFFDSKLHHFLEGVFPAVFLPGEVVADAEDYLLDDIVCDVRFQKDHLEFVEDVVEGVILDLFAQQGRAEHLGRPLSLSFDGFRRLLFRFGLLFDRKRFFFASGLGLDLFRRFDSLLLRNLRLLFRCRGDDRLLFGLLFLVDGFLVERAAFLENAFQLRF